MSAFGRYFRQAFHAMSQRLSPPGEDHSSNSDAADPGNSQSNSSTNNDTSDNSSETGDHSASHVNSAPTSPQSPEDIAFAVTLLHNCGLPNELVKYILHLASYDGILYRGTSNQDYTASGRHPGASRRHAYVSTPPLYYLGPYKSEQASMETNTDDTALTADKPPPIGAQGRIQRVTLSVTGRSQGWASFPDGGNWSWFDLAKVEKPGPHNMRFDGEMQISNALQWAHNPSVDPQRLWHTHSMEYRAYDPDSCPDDLKTLFKNLRDGDRLCILPMAQFGGWTNEVKSGTIEVFVELYR